MRIPALTSTSPGCGICDTAGMGQKFSKAAITLKGRAVGRYPFRTYSRSPIECCMDK